MNRYRPAVAGALIALVPVCARAELALHPFVSGLYQYDSNVFAVADADQGRALNGTADRDDRVERYAVGVEPTFAWGEQRARMLLEGRRLDYQRFQALDHDEYLVDSRLDWRATRDVGGSVVFRQERRMASFADRQTTELTMEREREFSASLASALSADWLTELTLRSRRLDSPLTATPATPTTPAVPAAPDFALHEDAAGVALKYTGLGRLTTGLRTELLDGRYTGVPVAPRFREGKVELTLSYTLSGVSTFDAAAGYTRREDRDGGGDLDEATGFVGYRRELTGKTRVRADVFRRISSYVGGANSVVDTGASAGVTWTPTLKITVDVAAEWARSRFADSASPVAVDARRRDRTESVTLDVGYALLQWLTVRGYASVRQRHSDSEFDRYEERVAGVELEARLSR